MDGLGTPGRDQSVDEGLGGTTPGEPRSCRAGWRVGWAEVNGRGEAVPWDILRGFVFTLVKIGARISQHERDLSRGSSLSWAPHGEVGAWCTQDGVTTGVRG